MPDKKWVAQPWFDEGVDYPESSGTPHIIEAESIDDAFAAFPVGEYTGLIDVHVMTPDEWKAKGGYPLEGLDD